LAAALLSHTVSPVFQFHLQLSLEVSSLTETYITEKTGLTFSTVEFINRMKRMDLLPNEISRGLGFQNIA